MTEDKILEDILERYNYSGSDSLIPILQDIQNELGRITEGAIVKVGKHLNIPTSKIYGLATFYNQFKFENKGEKHICLCNGTSCRLKGAKWNMVYLEDNYKLKNGQTTRDGRYSLEVTTCMGACEHGPVISINDDFYSKVDPETLKSILNDKNED
ncbi:NADH-quinone oxidoreductase subunit NuoE family protein [Tenuifilum thalassicum]|uniref:NAD(P)H-dependent oxidoreductase subunit E n=1 Tax=Tenuifilum thalassicum TaxID=2590900 RepID=A0A7D3Y4V9_9BACT|nr:NAD(P)H-dependent oxidoreductase subunit E [Tenuifilum thalassicum]QKG80269.1 NAD(P)H-dependent oxidoreductase subunit E [Tenuifilum thalassicum]